MEWDVMHKQFWVSLPPEKRDALWRKKYRMSYPLFLKLVEDLTPFIQKRDTKYRKAMEADRAVAMVLYRLAHGAKPSEVADMFNVETATVVQYTKLVTSVLANELYPSYIQIPEGPRLIQIIREFKELTGLDNMCGAVDGSHIKLSTKPPSRYTPADYWCRHDFHSVLLQRICDAHSLFWDVCVTAPGGTHDATHFRSSEI